MACVTLYSYVCNIRLTRDGSSEVCGQRRGFIGIRVTHVHVTYVMTPYRVNKKGEVEKNDQTRLFPRAGLCRVRCGLCLVTT